MEPFSSAEQVPRDEQLCPLGCYITEIKRKAQQIPIQPVRSSRIRGEAKTITGDVRISTTQGIKEISGESPIQPIPSIWLNGKGLKLPLIQNTEDQDSAIQPGLPIWLNGNVLENPLTITREESDLQTSQTLKNVSPVLHTSTDADKIQLSGGARKTEIVNKNQQVLVKLTDVIVFFSPENVRVPNNDEISKVYFDEEDDEDEEDNKEQDVHDDQWLLGGVLNEINYFQKERTKYDFHQDYGSPLDRERLTAVDAQLECYNKVAERLKEKIMLSNSGQLDSGLAVSNADAYIAPISDIVIGHGDALCHIVDNVPNFSLAVVEAGVVKDTPVLIDTMKIRGAVMEKSVASLIVSQEDVSWADTKLTLSAKLHKAEDGMREALQRLADLESCMQAERDDAAAAKAESDSLIVALHLQVKTAWESSGRLEQRIPELERSSLRCLSKVKKTKKNHRRKAAKVDEEVKATEVAELAAAAKAGRLKDIEAGRESALSSGTSMAGQLDLTRHGPDKLYSAVVSLQSMFRMKQARDKWLKYKLCNWIGWLQQHEESKRKVVGDLFKNDQKIAEYRTCQDCCLSLQDKEEYDALLQLSSSMQQIQQAMLVEWDSTIARCNQNIESIIDTLGYLPDLSDY